MNGARCHPRQPHLFQQLIDLASLHRWVEPKGQVQQHFAAATREQELVVRVLEHECRAKPASNVPGLGSDQTAQNPKQRAFAAAVAPYQHPKAWSGNLEAAAIERTGAARPAEADPFEPQSRSLGSVLRRHSGFEGKAWALGAAGGCRLFVDLYSQQVAGEHAEALAFHFFAGEFKQAGLTLLKRRAHLLIKGFCGLAFLALHGHRHGAHAKSQLNHVHRSILIAAAIFANGSSW